MKLNVKTIGYVIGVDCAAQPIVVNHNVEQTEEKTNIDVNSLKADLESAKKTLYLSLSL